MLISKEQAEAIIDKIITKCGTLGMHERYDPNTFIHWVDSEFVRGTIRNCVYAPPVEPKEPLDWHEHLEGANLADCIKHRQEKEKSGLAVRIEREIRLLKERMESLELGQTKLCGKVLALQCITSHELPRGFIGDFIGDEE